MSVIVVLSYSSIYSWLLNSCMLHSPTLFFLASSQTLGSCQISHLQLLFSSDCCFSFTHTHTLTLPSQEERRVVARFSVLFSSPPVLPRSIPGNFTFISAIPSLVRLVLWVFFLYCHLHISCATVLFSPVSFACFFPMSFQVREVFPMLLCSFSSVTEFVLQGRW